MVWSQTRLAKRIMAGVALVLSVFSLAACGPSGSDQQSGAQPPAVEDATVVNSSVYITMPDGVRLAADVWRPDSTGSAKYPTIVMFTRYWRALDLGEASQAGFEPPVTYFTGAGYVVVNVDVRGTGASFGGRPTEFSVGEVKDFQHVVDWIAAQPWSDGRVASYGVSYLGNTAELALIDPGSALKAAVPRFTDYDWFTSILFPGGLKNRIIGDRWADGVSALDSNDASIFGDTLVDGQAVKGVKPVNGDYEALAEAVSRHAHRARFAEQVNRTVFREDMKTASSLDGPQDALVSPIAFQDHIAANGIPAFHWASWYDAGTADGVIRRFASGKVKGRFVIGAWSHGGQHDADPFKDVDASPDPDVDTQYRMIDAFVSEAFGGAGAEVDQRILEYYTIGSGVWKATDVWPLSDTEARRLYLGPDFSLAPTVQGTPSGADTFNVDFSAGTGATSRWMTQVGGGDVVYDKDGLGGPGTLSYTSAPLSEPMEITGYPVVTLQASSSDGKGAVIAYLELVAPNGDVLMVTEGEIRLIHGVTDDLPKDQWVPTPYHSFSKKDGRTVRPGEVVPVSFTMLPTSIEVPAGYRLRLTIRGHDNDAFVPVGGDTSRTMTIFWGGDANASLTLPTIPKATGQQGEGE